MPFFIVEEDALGVLASELLPDKRNKNPFKDLIEFLDKARGRWTDERETRGVRSMIQPESGAAVPNGKLLYRSPEFSIGRLDISVVPQALGLIRDQLGLYAELVRYPAFVQMGVVDYEKNVPAYLPNAERLDEAENTVPVKWSEWKDSTHEHRVSGPATFNIPLNSSNGRDVAGTVLARLISDGFTVLRMDAYPQPDTGDLI